MKYKYLVVEQDYDILNIIYLSDDVYMCRKMVKVFRKRGRNCFLLRYLK